MPMNRYEIRDEYSLADPELYRAADKDDPEALLEGVAMAGLVGVLRQLGDLSEFAAEIFHDLHEEVMVTAARGNSLMIRVQQLESDVHSVEKAFLSQTDHSKFFYNAGLDWKANQQVDQNLIAQGNLPRFVMDSYEECRGPPRLFLLDKFDIAGAGACLKRYTDPSFFKVEASATANVDVPREKKIRKAKKKGPRVRYGDRPECLQLSSHAKLHQLLLEEPVENGVSKPAYRAKLKRRPNRFPFDSISGKSYMEQVLKSPSPEHKMLHEITVYSTLQNSDDDHDESAFELRSVSPARETGGKSKPPYADKEDTMQNPSLNQSFDALSDIRTYGVPDVILSISDKETAGKGIVIEERSLIGYQSDDIASEIDNYVDAPSTMLPEMDSDSELRVKSDFTLYTESQPLVSVKSQEHCHSLSLDSQSTGEFSISDEGNNSYQKEMSSFLSSDSPRTSAENAQLEKLSADRFPCTDITEFVVVNASSLERTPEHLHVDEVSKSVTSNYSFPGKDSTPNRPNFVQPTSSLCRTSSVPTSPHYDVRAVAREGGLRGSNSDETISNSDDEEQKRDLILDSPCSSSVSHSKSLGDNSRRSSSGGHTMDGEIRWVSRSANIITHSSDRLDAVSPSFRLEDDYDRKDVNQFENIIGSEEIVSEENPTPRTLENKVAKLDDNFAIDYYDIARLGDNVALEVSEGDNQYNLYTEYPNVVSEPVNSEAHCYNSSNVNQINAETLILSGIEHSVLLEDLDTHDTGITPEEPTPINGTSELGNRNISEVVGTGDVTPNDIVPPESSFYVPGNIGDSSKISYTVESDGVNPDSGIGGQPLTEISSPLSLKLPSQVHVSLHEFDPVTDQSETAEIACSVPAVSDETIKENGVLGKLVEEHVPCSKDLGIDVLENGTTSLSGLIRELEVVEEEKSDLSESHLDSSLVEEVEEREAAILDCGAVFKTEHDDRTKPEVSPTDFSSYLDSEVKHKADMVSAATVQPLLEQSGLDTQEESVLQNSIDNQVSDVDSLHVGCVAEESSLPESTELPPASIGDELPKSSKILNSEMSSVLPTSQLQLSDHYDNKEFESLASSFPPVNHSSSVSVFPEGRGYGADASAYPKDSLGFIFAPGDLFPATNQISLDQLQPLPPLPPIQWRKGKLQHALSTPELGKIEIKEPLPQEIFPPATSIEDDSSLPEQMKQSPIQSPEITFKEENIERGSRSKANSLHEAIDLPQRVENEHLRIFTPMKESEVPSPAEVVGVAEGSQTVKLPVQIVPHFTLKEDTTEHTLLSLEVDPMNQAADPPPKVKTSEVSSPTEEVGVAEGSQTVQLPVQIVPHSTLKEDNAEHSLPSMDADPINQAADPPLKVKASEVPSPAEEVGVAEGSPTVKLPVQIVPHFTIKEEDAEHCSPTLEADRMNQAADPPPKAEKEQQRQLHLATQESEVSSPAVEDEASNESRKKILPRTCNPVIGSVAALDKSRLRKVTERVAPQIEKQDERDALLDQIRAKSFNLKPTAISRPSIQAPNTNLRVAAILEKANAIRQAFAGSDEDDEDNWSDS